jgi:hypothetical protein
MRVYFFRLTRNIPLIFSAPLVKEDDKFIEVYNRGYKETFLKEFIEFSTDKIRLIQRWEEYCSKLISKSEAQTVQLKKQAESGPRFLTL